MYHELASEYRLDSLLFHARFMEYVLVQSIVLGTKEPSSFSQNHSATHEEDGHIDYKSERPVAVVQ